MVFWGVLLQRCLYFGNCSLLNILQSGLLFMVAATLLVEIDAYLGNKVLANLTEPFRFFPRNKKLTLIITNLTLSECPREVFSHFGGKNARNNEMFSKKPMNAGMGTLGYSFGQ